MIPFLPEQPPQLPSPNTALTDPNGLLAAGGDLTPEWLLLAYEHGIFPWFNSDDEPIYWWSPSPRPVITAQQPRINRSLRKALKHAEKCGYHYRLNTAFSEVISQCAKPRLSASNADEDELENEPETETETETWITERMKSAYIELHQLGHAHSIELWHDERLLGGFYGVKIGHFFFGESMFSRVNNASKLCFIRFCYAFAQAGGRYIDSQVPTEHMTSLGAQLMQRTDFLAALKNNTNRTIEINPEQLNAPVTELFSSITSR